MIGVELTQHSEKRDAHGIPCIGEKGLALPQVEDKRNPGKYKFIVPQLLLKDNMVVPYVNFRRSADPMRFPCPFTIFSRTLFRTVAFPSGRLPWCIFY